MSSLRVATEVPECLKHLVRMVARGFVGVNQLDILIINLLLAKPCLKELEILKLLRYKAEDLRVLRTRLKKLRDDKLIHIRVHSEPSFAEPKRKKLQTINYYYINLKSFVNVVKFKLSEMRKRLDKMEREVENRSTLKCTSCGKYYSDLEAGDIFEVDSCSFMCVHCYGPVHDDREIMRTKDFRLRIAKFNEQTQCLADILRKSEEFILSAELVYPDPTHGRLDGPVASSSTASSGVLNRIEEPVVVQPPAEPRLTIEFRQSIPRAAKLPPPWFK